MPSRWRADGTANGPNLARKENIMTPHTSVAFENELRDLRDRVLAMGECCERMVAAAFQAFWHGAPRIAAALPALEARLDRDEIDIERRALQIVALRQPVAGDLRLLATTLRLVTDLERVGDGAVKIAECAGEPTAQARTFAAESLKELDAAAQSMLRLALESLVRRDVDSARYVLRRDDAVHHRCAEVLALMTSYIASHPEDAAAGLRVLWVAEYLERVADHATNVAEEVVFLVDGEDVRHADAISTQRTSAGTHTNDAARAAEHAHGRRRSAVVQKAS
jgi:phosphate transport system protein